MTQAQAILVLLRRKGSQGITAMDALHVVGSFRLAARINELRAEGHDIRSAMVPTRDGRRVARYWLVEAPVVVQQALDL